MMADGWASVGRRRGCWRHGRQLQLDQHHVIAKTHCQIQRRFARQEIVYLYYKNKMKGQTFKKLITSHTHTHMIFI